MSGSLEEWEAWKAQTGHHELCTLREVMHRATPWVSLETHAERKRAELERSLEGKKLIYLDSNHWIRLCDVLVQSPNTVPAYVEILERLRQLRKDGRICCPLSAPLVEELMKQSGVHELHPDTRRATASVMDELSGGVAIQNWLDLIKAEFGRHIIRTFKLTNPPESQFRVWTKVGFVFDEHVSVPEVLSPEEETVAEKVYFDMRWQMSCVDYQAMPDWKPIPKSMTESWLAECEAARAVTDKRDGFPKIIRGGRTALIRAVRGGWSNLYALCQGQPGNPSEHVKQVLDPIYEGTDPKALPSLEVVAGLEAVIALDRSRKYHANDIWDLMHIACAMPYCDALFSEKDMVQRLRDGRLDFVNTYQTVIGSRPEEMLAYLKSLL